MLALSIEPNPLLAVAAFETKLPSRVGSLAAAPGLAALLSLEAVVPLKSDDELRDRVRKMLRHGGYKPSGRGKPASEYLLRAAGDGTLAAINPVVDACNVASLHSGFPISVVDLDRTRGALAIRVGRAGESYVFNASGQTIELEGLVVLCDDDGPSANAVKDAQRTKTHDEPVRPLSVLWGTRADEARLAAAASWYASLLREHLGAETLSAPLSADVSAPTSTSSEGSRSEAS
jgi:DNA/RNA-binding domain of Phe-tRNA-synthetase-like protein